MILHRAFHAGQSDAAVVCAFLFLARDVKTQRPPCGGRISAEGTPYRVMRQLLACSSFSRIRREKHCLFCMSLSNMFIQGIAVRRSKSAVVAQTDR